MTANQRRKESRSSGESRRRKSGVPSPKRSEDGFSSLASATAGRMGVGPPLEDSGAAQWNNAAAPITMDMPRMASICSPGFRKLFTMGTLLAERSGDLVHAPCGESPLAFPAIHTPPAFQRVNWLKPKKSKDRVKPAV